MQLCSTTCCLGTLSRFADIRLHCRTAQLRNTQSSENELRLVQRWCRTEYYEYSTRSTTPCLQLTGRYKIVAWPSAKLIEPARKSIARRTSIPLEASVYLDLRMLPGTVDGLSWRILHQFEQINSASTPHPLFNIDVQCWEGPWGGKYQYNHTSHC